MFCPKCGRDCGDANFCLKCGQTLYSQITPQTFVNTEKKLQASGQVYCPRCLSTNVTVCSRKIGINKYLLIRGMFALAMLIPALFRKAQSSETGGACLCKDCGNEWFTDRTVLHKEHEKILTRHLGAYSTIAIPAPEGSCLQFGRTGIRIYRTEEDAPVISYDEITSVKYQESIGPLYGWITLRDRANKNVPLPNVFADAKQDKLTIFCHYHYANSYYQIFCALKEIAEENKKAGLF